MTNNSSPVVVDWNEDGLLDLLVGSDASSDGIRLFLNSGTATSYQFTDYTKVEANGSSIALARCQIQVEDLNYDGKKDLIAGYSAGRFYFYENTGTNAAPVLAAAVLLQKTDNSTITGYGDVRGCFADWNEDGGLDLLWSEYYPENNIHLYLGEVPSGISEHDDFSQLTNYPKNIVTNGQLLFNLNLEKGQKIDLRLYAANGTLVETIEKGKLGVGEQKMPIDIGRHPVGVYFVHYRVDNRDLRQKIVLVK